MVLHNPNNWHWVNKDASAWAKTYLKEKLHVSQRKGKVITLFDVKLQLEYEGKTKDQVSVSGTITIPEVAHDTEEDEYVFEIENYSDSASKQPVKDLVRSKLVPQIRQELGKLAPALIAEHGKDIQHAPGVDPSSGFATPPSYPQTSKGASPAPQTTTTTTTTNKVAVNTTTVTASDEFRTTAEEMYTTFTDPQRIAAFTRGAPRQFDGAQVGGKFSIFDGNVNGEFVKLDKPKQIVQKWRLAQWPEGHFSTLEINFDQNDVDAVTQMRVTWTGVPVGQEDVTKQNWDVYYVRSIKQTFGSRPTSWRQLLIALFVLFIAIGLALFSDRIHGVLETTY
ncbi:Co-chaperone [Aspergillus fumigatus]